VVYGAFAYLYGQYRRQLERELGLRLVAVASASAAAVNDEVWERLTGGDVARAREELEAVRRQNGVSDIFVFDLLEVTVLDLGGRYPQGESNLALAQDVEAVAFVASGLPAVSRLYEEGGTYLKSGYAPVFDAEGDVVGGVGVEASAAFVPVLAALRGKLAVAALLVLLGMVLLGLGFAGLLAARTGLEGRLRRAETLAAVGQMAAMMAHEIRNPLGIIRGAAERLSRRHGLADDELFRFIPEEVDRLERTVGHYLDFARPRDPGQGDDVGEALERTLALAAPELERSGVRVVVERDPGPLPVRADPHLLQQAFLNIALNARDAMPGGGTFTVTLRRKEARIEVRCADTGVGMTEEVRARATEPFFTAKAKGSGLGLAVVGRVMDDVGGRLEIQSRPGRGTTLVLWFPQATADGDPP
jgi:nitrogen-specific signal transduction histidine kinase